MMLLLLSLLGLIPTFQKSKCKKLLNTTMERIKLLSSRRDAQLRQLRNDLAKLLQLGKQQKAQVWLGRICKELQLRSVYIKISAYCQSVQVNLMDIAGHSDCPESLQEPLSGLCFAASCCADLPELQELREMFMMKYGKNFVASAHELGRKCLVKEEAVEDIAADDELKHGIEQALRKQHTQQTMDADNYNELSLPFYQEGTDFVPTSLQAATAMRVSGIVDMAFEEAMGTAQVKQSKSSSPLLTPRRSASMPNFSHCMNNETSSADSSPPFCHCPTMAKNQVRESSKGGIHVHPRLPKYEDLVASFTALKH